MGCISIKQAPSLPKQQDQAAIDRNKAKKTERAEKIHSTGPGIEDSREAVEAPPSLKALNARLDVVLSNLSELEASLPIGGGWN